MVRISGDMLQNGAKIADERAAKTPSCRKVLQHDLNVLLRGAPRVVGGTNAREISAEKRDWFKRALSRQAKKLLWSSGNTRVCVLKGAGFESSPGQVFCFFCFFPLFFLDFSGIEGKRETATERE